MPGANRLVVAERHGKIYTFADDPATDATRPAARPEGTTVYGVALHPKFAENGYVYVANVPDDPETRAPTAAASRASR